MLPDTELAVLLDNSMLSHIEVLQAIGKQFEVLTRVEDTNMQEFGEFLFKLSEILDRSPMGKLIIADMQKG